jgi:hypothetical protein
MPKPFALNQAQQRRLGKLAREAGRPAAETLKLVLRDGFEYCEWEVLESRAADAETKRRGAVSDGEAQRRVRQVLDSAHGRRRNRKAACVGPGRA